MADVPSTQVGTVLWRDLTVPDAERVRDFYQQVVGWTSSSVPMGDYSDFNMMPPGSSAPVAGVCHARGPNSDLPAQWLMYIIVDDVDRSAADTVRLGGRVLNGPRAMSGGRVCVIEDPAGAVCALFQPPPA
jgi:predicted enzyme related to lactoylglutathione lyase